ncbi:MAG: hypothetical protein M3167_09830 [Acidobacteriota bacterium]|nr:hypothetical protein [Acidobacteriota bacterium]
MGIENWPSREDGDGDKNTPVDEPRRHMLGSFRPGQGFAPSEIDDDETLTAPIELETEEAPFPDSDETLDVHLGHR